MTGKKFILAALFAALMNPVWGGPVHFGVTSGVDFGEQTVVSTPPGVERPILLGYTGGLFLEVEVSDFLSIQPEVDFVMKGTDYKNPASSTTQTMVFNYLEFPVLVKVRTTLAPGLAGFLSAGPTANLLLNEITFLTSPGFEWSGDQTRYYPAFDMGLVFGAGLTLDNLVLDLRFELGLIHATQTIIVDPQASLNRALSFQLGYRIL